MNDHAATSSTRAAQRTNGLRNGGRLGGVSVLFLGLAIGGLGCQQALASASAGDPQTATVATASAAPMQLAAPLPPTPVPATFDVAALAEQVKPVVVNVTTTQKVESSDAEAMDPFDFFFGPRGRGPGPHEHGARRQALGTGFIIDPNGFVVTNEHVVHDADEVHVRLADDREFKAEVVGRDPKLDVALLKLEGAKNLPTARLGDSEHLRVGEHVLAVGNPFGLGHTVTLGIVSAKARTIGAGPYDDFIQTDASINPGNSGGPLFNWRGEVIGINTAIRAGANGIGFAIPSDAVKDVLPQLREKGHVDRGRLGLGFQPLTQELAHAVGVESAHGALVTEVMPGSAAARAGIQSGDVVTAVNGETIGHAEELPRKVARHQPGTTIKLTVVHEKQSREVSATLEPQADDEASAPSARGEHRRPAAKADRLGLAISESPNGTGVRVDDVDPNGPAHDLSRGDVIIEVNHVPVHDAASLRAAFAKATPGSTALVKVRRGQGTAYVPFTLPR